MQNSGFGNLAGGDELARSTKEPTAVAARSATARQCPQEQRKRAEYDVEQATSAANKAITARQETHAQLEAADQTVAETGDRVERVAKNSRRHFRHMTRCAIRSSSPSTQESWRQVAVTGSSGNGSATRLASRQLCCTAAQDQAPSRGGAPTSALTATA